MTKSGNKQQNAWKLALSTLLKIIEPRQRITKKWLVNRKINTNKNLKYTQFHYFHYFLKL
tara:strand:+ start:92 stop:271 length:180 start_codon:yes stop_codon:yes gene_type:complete